MSHRKIAILGAGPAGVGAAFRLAETGVAAATVLERNRSVGGLAGSFELAGVHVDFGSHRLHPACDAQVMADIRRLLGDDLLDRPRHGRIRLRGRWIHFPLKPLDLMLSLPPTFSMGVAIDAGRKMLPSFGNPSRTENFGTILELGLGRTICRDFYFPYAEKIWGLAPDRLSAIQAKRRVQAGSLTKLVRKALGGLPGLRRPGVGRFFYPREGFGQIANRLAEAAAREGAKFVFGANIESVRMRPNRTALIEYSHEGSLQQVEADYVWSTIPVTALVKALQPTAPADVLEACERIRFRSMILIYLVVEQRQFSEFDAHYFPESDIAITRLSEPKNYANRSEPHDRTVLCAELPCSTEDAHWSMSDNELKQVVSDSLNRSGIPLTGRVAQVVTRRLPQAYPIYESGYEVDFETIDDWLASVKNVLSFGRQGLFAHDNTHHTLAMAYAAISCLGDQGEFDVKRWGDYRRIFESHVVED